MGYIYPWFESKRSEHVLSQHPKPSVVVHMALSSVRPFPGSVSSIFKGLYFSLCSPGCRPRTGFCKRLVVARIFRSRIRQLCVAPLPSFSLSLRQLSLLPLPSTSRRPWRREGTITCHSLGTMSAPGPAAVPTPTTNT